MVSFLESQLRNSIAKGFKGRLLVGTLTRAVSGGLDEYGDPLPGTTQSFRVEGFPDEYNEAYRVTAGIPEGDSKVVLIAGNCETAPLKDDKISFSNFPTFQVRKVKTDPALAHYECQSYKV